MTSNSNSVTLLGFYGGDESHSLSAWQSTNLELNIELSEDIRERIHQLFEATVVTKKKDYRELLKILAEHGHHTPFEKSCLHFQIRGDVGSHIHCLKHRVGISINSECLTGDTIITFVNKEGSTNNSQLKKSIKELWEKWNRGRLHQNTEKDKEYLRSRIRKMNIRVLNEKTGYFEMSHIKDIYCSGIKPVYKIITSSGKEITCSPNHRFWSKEGTWLKIEDSSLKVGSEIGVNGIKTNVKNKPWTFPEFYSTSYLYTRVEFAKQNNIKYELCKKWGYIFNAKFKEDENKDFKKGNTPWNKDFTGYKINISEKGLENRKKAIKRGKDSHFWRGGITEERALIGAWTRNQARKVHQKYDWTCQHCTNKVVNPHAHHILPVAQYPEYAENFDNLITVCQSCHNEIHSSLECEEAFARKVLDIDFEPFCYQKRIGTTKTNGSTKLRVHFDNVVSIEYVGEQETYDLEIEGEFKNFVANNFVVHNSARYKELEDKWYLPDDWEDIQLDEHSISYEPNGYTLKQLLDDHTRRSHKYYHLAIEKLTPKLGRIRAKESARYFLSYNKQLDFDIMFNFRSFAHFQELRNSPHAQLEIREIAQMMLEQIKAIPGNPFQYTLEAFGM